MNILFITTHINTGGITSYVLTLGRALIDQGHRVWVASSGGNCLDLIQKAGIKHVTINIRTKSEIHPKVIGCVLPLQHLIKREKIDIIHAQTRVTQVLGFILSRMMHLPLITTCHGFFKPRFFRRIFPCWGDAVIAISKPVAAHLEQDFKVPLKHIHLISHGIDLNIFKPMDEPVRTERRRERNYQDAFFLGSMARLSDIKGLDILIKAMPAIIKQIPNARLLIAGDGPQEMILKDLSKALNLTAYIQFEHHTTRIFELISLLDIFVMPSLNEGLGLSVMEAQACGVPVVASRVGGLIDLIEHNHSGLLVKPGNPDDLAAAIITLYRDPSLAKRMASQGLLNIAKNYTLDGMVQQTIKVYTHEADSCR